jgi:Trypsin-like peptidase domain
MRAARDATVSVCERGGEHKGQGLLLRLGGAEGTVVLTCHHVVAAVRQEEDLRVRLPLPNGTLGEPAEVAYDRQRSRPGQDAAVLRIREDAEPSGSAVPLLHKLGSDTYDGSLLATVLTRLIPDSFDATVRPSAQIEGRAATGNGWPDASELYRLRAFRLAEATYSEPGFSGGVVLCEGGVLGLAHFGRTETPHRSREAYLVPLSAWAEGWPELEGLIEPLVDEKLRGAATVKRAAGLSVGIGADWSLRTFGPRCTRREQSTGWSDGPSRSAMGRSSSAGPYPASPG